MAFLAIDKETCTKCGLCATQCSIVYFREGSFPRQLPVGEDACMQCGHCVAICPTGSLTHKAMTETPQLEKSLDVTFEQCAQLIRGRRSIRNFQDREVSRDVIESVLDVARYSPTGHNFQDLKWLVINSQDKIKEIKAIGAEWLRYRAQTSPEFAEMFAPMIKKLDAGEETFLQGAPAAVLTYNSKHNLVSNADCVIAMSYFNLAADAAGLGCCWAGLLMNAAATYPDMIEAIGLPEGATAYAALMVGYPVYRYTWVPARRSAQVTWM